MDSALTDRRSAPRLRAAALQIEQALLRPGCPVDVVDLSPGGAQVQSARPLRPGSRVHVRLLAGEQSLAVAARVTRCAVWKLDSDAVVYRGALHFEEECRPFWEEQARIGCVLLNAPP